MSKFRHFKGEIYEVHTVSVPVKEIPFAQYMCKEAMHTETKERIDIVTVEGRTYHLEDDCKDALVIYSKPQERMWARPYDDFMSKIHIGRQDNKTKQPFRFMLIE